MSNYITFYWFLSLKFFCSKFVKYVKGCLIYNFNYFRNYFEYCSSCVDLMILKPANVEYFIWCPAVFFLIRNHSIYCFCSFLFSFFCLLFKLWIDVFYFCHYSNFDFKKIETFLWFLWLLTSIKIQSKKLHVP